MRYNTVYVVNFKETIFVDGKMEVHCGTCEWGYDNLDDAIAQVSKLADDAINENIEAFEALIGFCDSNDNGDMKSVTIGTNTYEYWVSNVGVAM